MKDNSFKERIDRLLKAAGRTFQGIHLRCKACGDEAFAATPNSAAMFGWSDVTQLHGPYYEDLCIECKDSPLKAKGESP